MATFGGFPGVEVTTQSGGISSVAVGDQEKLVIFGEANYDGSNNVDGTASAESAEQIRAPKVADDKFGSGSELADAMKNALANGANIDYLYGIAVKQVSVAGETQGSQSGTLDNVEIEETVDVDKSDSNDAPLIWDDDGTELDVELRYDGAPNQPSDSSTVYLNPLTGQYHAGAAPSATEFEIDYNYYDYASALSSTEAQNTLNENETGVWMVLSDSDSVSSDVDSAVSTLRGDYKMATAMQPAEPNDDTVLDSANKTNENGGAHARYDPSTYSSSANNSISQEYYYKFAPGRVEESTETIGGGLGGLFAGNAISDPIYNDQVSGYSALQQQFSRSQAKDMRSANVIPVRSTGSVRVTGNTSTAGTTSSVAGDFFTRRIADRVILIGKQVGDSIIGRINEPSTRADAEAAIEGEMRSLSRSNLIKPNTADETNWTVTVYPDENNDNRVNIDIEFTPYGVVKRVGETITIDT